MNGIPATTRETIIAEGAKRRKKGYIGASSLTNYKLFFSNPLSGKEVIVAKNVL